MIFRRAVAACAVAVAFAAFSCGDPEPVVDEALLPLDYRSSFTVVRGCRSSVDHDLAHIKVWVDAKARDSYEAGPYPFAPGATVVKEEFADATCASLTGWTLMRKEDRGYDSASGDWRWLRVDGDRHVLEDGKIARCSHCHLQCAARDFACAEP